MTASRVSNVIKAITDITPGNGFKFLIPNKNGMKEKSDDEISAKILPRCIASI